MGSIHLDGYDVNRSDRNAAGEGVATYIKEYLKPITQTILQDKYQKWRLETTISLISLSWNGSMHKFVVIGLYRPPNSGITWFMIFNDLIVEIASEGLPCILGDLNADLMKPDTGPGKLLLHSFELAAIKVPTITPTRVSAGSATCLDVIALPE